MDTKNVLKILHNGRVQEVQKNCINGFSKKNSYLGQLGPFGPQKWHGVITLDPLFKKLQNERDEKVIIR